MAACTANAVLAGCEAVLPRTQGSANEPVTQAINTVVDVINTRTQSAARPVAFVTDSAARAAAVPATVPQDPETAPRIAGSSTAVPALIVPVAGMNGTASIAEPGAGTSGSGPATASAASGEKNGRQEGRHEGNHRGQGQRGEEE
jgi:uncharacterized protein YceK